jgi:hypothetical protein
MICLTVMKIETKVFWDVVTGRLVDRYQHFGGLWRFRLRLRAWRQRDVGVCVPLYSVTPPEGSIFNISCAFRTF